MSNQTFHFRLTQMFLLYEIGSADVDGEDAETEDNENGDQGDGEPARSFALD
jgi:hypothetical protein